MHEYALSDLDTVRLLRAVLAALLDGKLSGQRSHATLRAISASHTRKRGGKSEAETRGKVT